MPDTPTTKDLQVQVDQLTKVLHAIVINLRIEDCPDMFKADAYTSPWEMNTLEEYLDETE